MTSAFDAIAATRIIVSLPRLGREADRTRRSAARSPVVVEVCAQEGLDVVSVPFADLDVLDSMDPVADRVVFGVGQVRTIDDIDAVAATRARFVIVDVATPDLVARARTAGLTVVGGAFSPTEIAATAVVSPDAVIIHPAEVLGTLYVPHALAAAGPLPVIAGGVNSYVAQQWLSKGALAATTDESFVADALVDGNLGWLRDRARTFATEGRAAPIWSRIG